MDSSATAYAIRTDTNYGTFRTTVVTQSGDLGTATARAEVKVRTALAQAAREQGLDLPPVIIRSATMIASRPVQPCGCGGPHESRRCPFRD